MGYIVINRALKPSPIWTVYIVETAQGTLYTGISTDVDRRVRQHSGELKGGAKYLRNKAPLQIVATWQADSKSLASKLEYWIKKQPRSKKLQLINNKTNLTIEKMLAER